MRATEVRRVHVPPAPDGGEVLVQLVQDDDALREAATRFGTVPLVGIDTEFERTRTYFARPGIAQVAVPGHVFIIDLTCDLDPTPLSNVLANPDVTLVAHSASEDVQLLEHLCGVRCKGVFDTQTAAALAGLGAGLGFHALVDRLLGIDLPKDQTRSDWLARPLADAQLDYAALDAALLLPLHEALSGQLDSLGRLGWVGDDCERAQAAARRSLEPEHCWERLKGLERLPPAAQHRAAHLAAWRERTVRDEDMPRGHLLKDGALLALARARSVSMEDLRRIDDLHPRILRRYGQRMVDAHRQAARTVGNEEAPLRPPLPAEEAATMAKALKAEVADVAAELDLAPEVVASRRELDRLVVAALARPDESTGAADVLAWPEALAGWRREALEARLMPILQRSPS